MFLKQHCTDLLEKITRLSGAASIFSPASFNMKVNFFLGYKYKNLCQNVRDSVFRNPIVVFRRSVKVNETVSDVAKVQLSCCFGRNGLCCLPTIGGKIHSGLLRLFVQNQVYNETYKLQ